ncbi:MAG: head-tail connector protein, partial [Acidobacteria bacterium]|nr:head-tail connector protein [Acidobacteriota bacterium]
KMHLRVTQSDENDHIQMLVHSCSAAVINYIGAAADNFLDSSGFPESSSDLGSSIPDEVRLATLYLIGCYYRDRDGERTKEWTQNYLPFPVLALLYPLRLPTVQ